MVAGRSSIALTSPRTVPSCDSSGCTSASVTERSKPACVSKVALKSTVWTTIRLSVRPCGP
eukprot:4734188-Pleurochrysis_carterae.AAC.1